MNFKVEKTAILESSYECLKFDTKERLTFKTSTTVRSTEYAQSLFSKFL